jgi:hypothetical protein
MIFNRVLAVVCLTAAVCYQAFPALNADESTHLPQLSHAELLQYPPLARLLRLAGTVEFRVVIDKGSVVDAEVKSVIISSCNCPSLTEEGKKKLGLYLSNPALANLNTWKFQSLDRNSFSVKYVYLVEGEPTSTPDNSRVDFNLPVVKITARPIKPACFDCGADIVGERTP